MFVVEGCAAAEQATGDAVLVTRRVAEKITTLETPPDVMAIFPLGEPPPLVSLVSPHLLAVYADRVADPGNLGTLVRAAAAFGASALVTSPGCVDLHAPKVVRATMGAVFSLPLYADHLLKQVLRDLGAPRAYGLAAHGGEDLRAARLQRPAVLVVGAERAGLSPDVEGVVSDRLTIPLAAEAGGAVESLNAGIAGAIALYEFARRAGALADTREK